MKTASAKPARPTVTAKHSPVEKFSAGKALEISVNVASPTPRRVTLHYRHVNQAERWQSVELKPNCSTFAGEIPGDYTAKRYALQYYFEIETGPAAATLFPTLATDLANTPYFIVRRGA